MTMRVARLPGGTNVVAPMARILIWLVRLYQKTLAVFLGGQCRFYPSCSHYAVGCLEAHGAARGSLLSLVRLCKCHPFHEGGHDPVPQPGPR